ncbi:type I polyketide synthase [Rhodopirellula islandica]|uniref:type I polyketide synthase n=1 Tax=Rhodopirellula islandica TaxID=595434 RepID=UPI000649701E|nr:type I polyketide synthase [Rhodopirellula islandica]
MSDSAYRRMPLITGASGMLGSYVVAELLRGRTECAVLVRAKGKLTAEQRMEQILGRFENAWQVSLPRPKILEGDLNRDDLGLKEESCEWVRANCDRILHSAASLSFLPADPQGDNEPYRTNVDGTRNVVAFCQKVGISQFHHVSTAYVCGKRSGRVKESEGTVGQSFANDYERSKLIAEGIVRESFGESSLTVYRPSIVIDRTGLSPVSGDRTIYGAFSMYQMLASRFGLPEDGQWFRDLGFSGSERKNIVDVDWIARAICKVMSTPRLHGRTYHLTTREGTAIQSLDAAFHSATTKWLQTRKPDRLKRPRQLSSASIGAGSERQELDQMAGPFVKTFLPYFRDDPIFDRANIDDVIATTHLDDTPEIGSEELLQMIGNWSAVPSKAPKVAKPASATGQPKAKPATVQQGGDPDDCVICGFEVRLPGGVDSAQAFEEMLFEGRSVIAPMPEDRLNRELYFENQKGVPGKTYTQLGGCVSPEPLDVAVEQAIGSLGVFDLTHRQFAQVAVAALKAASGTCRLSSASALHRTSDRSLAVDPVRAGVFVGHSGGTELGGPLAMATMADTTMELVDQVPSLQSVDSDSRKQVKASISSAIRQDRPRYEPGHSPAFNAYSAASLAARLMGFEGRREVIDAACSSSLLALQHAASAIEANRLDLAVVGGATFNNVDNLALFSQSGACSETGSFPFDNRASGLISSEGYVAVVVARRSVAEANGLPVLATLRGVGVASDGKGKGLWAPRSEGQQTAMRRAVDSDPLNIDYLECHATSTQVGDATELESLTSLLRANQSQQGVLPIGSVKSNLGHLLEAAGLVGVVKCLLAMRRGQIPPSIHFALPTERHDWTDAPVRIVDRVEPWQQRTSSDGRVAAVNAFGIGGLNAHAVIEEKPSVRHSTSQTNQEEEPIAIVGRGVVLPGAANLQAFRELLQSGRSAISDPPEGRWVGTRSGAWLGVNPGSDRSSYTTPHCRGGYVRDFKFDAQSYRIPPKMVANANPAQLMLIEAVRQAMDEFDGGQWSVDRERVGVVVGTIFGGQFSNELQIGLRLPEITQHLRRSLASMGWDDSKTNVVADELRTLTLEKYGALLDETGGFTASTLASRIARTFDLMGGAFAVDADEASGGLALITAMEQLHAGAVDLALCGVTQRGMDLVAFEQLARKEQLLPSGRPEDLPDDGSQIIPGEGVAVLTLQRLSDAKAQGRTILGVLSKPTEAFSSDVVAARAESALRSRMPGFISSQKLVGQIGHLGGGQGIIRAIAATLTPKFSSESSSSVSIPIGEVADDGYRVNYSVSPQMNYEPSTLPTGETPLISTSLVSTPQPTSSVSTRSLADALVKESGLGSSGTLVVRLQCATLEGLRVALSEVASGKSASESCVPAFTSSSVTACRAVLLGKDDSELSAAASAAIAGPIRQQVSGVLAKKDGWVWLPNARSSECASPRVGWLFPGQGSQYSAVPAWLDTNDSSASRAFLDGFDQQLKSLGLPVVSDRLHDPDSQLGRDVWWTQAWVLAVGSMFADSLLRRGLRPDVVLGHSFGECTAAWCAGVVTTRQAIEFAKSRSDSVVMTTRERGELLSVRGAPSAVDAALQGSEIRYTISHHNSPQQTVIAGDPEQMTAAKKQLASAGMASVVIPVPAAFHTPEMMPAQEMLRARFTGQNARPPRFAFLSAVSNRYLAEPSEIVDNLVTQLTRPVCFSGATERLVHDGCELLVEVGPNNVLTRLATATVAPHVLCMSADDRGRDPNRQRQLIELAYESLGQSTRASSESVSKASASVVSSQTHVHQPSTLTASRPAFEVVDVTRRSRRQQEVSQEEPRSASAQDSGVKASSAVAESVTVHSVGKNGSDHRNGMQNGDVVSSPMQPMATVTTAANPVADTGMRERLQSARSFLFDLVVDLTGYDPEVIEFDADLEAELGVDSIKKAQLIGEIVQWGNLEVDTQSMRLAQFASLDDILQLVGDPAGLEDTELVSAPIDARGHNDQPESNPTEDFNTTAESLQRLMIDLVVDQTGYDEDIIDMDADLEGELGIDSIKRAQLLGELEQQYELQSLRESNLKLSDFPTLTSIHAFVMEQIGQPADEKKNASLNLSSDSSEVTSQAPASGTHRFVMRTKSAPRRDGMPAMRPLNGAALILGNNSVADAIANRCQMAGVPVHRIAAQLTLTELDAELDRVWSVDATPHLFLTTPHDDAACWTTLDAASWKRRQSDALAIPYRVCQRWMQRTIDEDRMAQASLVSTLKMGGGFGFDAMSELAQSSKLIHGRSAESGGLAGLTKAMLIEAWMRGYRDTPMLIIDQIEAASPDELAEGVFRELAVPSYDEEVAVAGEKRLATEARYSPLDVSSQMPQVTPGGTWIVAGGGRGITAMTAMALAERHGLKLHLLGMAPVPHIDPSVREHAQRDRADLRRSEMARIQREGGNPVKTWRQFEKAIEIDLTLEECRERSIEATYHSVNVSDFEAVAEVVAKIRSMDGPIRGVIQGAGSGQDARFDRKRPDKVAQCFSAKIDGTIALASATQNDPLEWFIGYGSISGRFGANGHTDYSAANEMLAKLIGRLRQQRPETRCVTFHWHAWGDVGMATKPEAKLALDMIGMEFMPAEEGLQHFLNEVEHGGEEAEVLITDRRYVRKFFPAESSRAGNTLPGPSPMIDPTERMPATAQDSFAVTLDPERDLFLKHHLVNGRPTLPFVMAIELLAESARWGTDHKVVRCREVSATMPLKFMTDDAIAVELLRDPSVPGRWSLVSDLRRRDGRLVQAQRPHFAATIELGDDSVPVVSPGNDEMLESAVEYASEQAPIYHGPSLQCLRSIGFGNADAGLSGGDPAKRPRAVGTIVAPSPAHLAGEARPLLGWVLSPATMDAVLYAAGMLAYRVADRPSLPISFDSIEIGRLPDPGEPLKVHVQWEGETTTGSSGGSDGGMMSAVLVGQNQELILRIGGYRIGWLR